MIIYEHAATDKFTEQDFLQKFGLLQAAMLAQQTELNKLRESKSQESQTQFT